MVEGLGFIDWITPGAGQSMAENAARRTRCPLPQRLVLGLGAGVHGLGWRDAALRSMLTLRNPNPQLLKFKEQASLQR